MKRLTTTLDALSQLVNVAFFPNLKDTSANESVSGRAYRKGWFLEKVIDTVLFWQPHHCKSSYENDLDRAKKYILKEINK